MIVLLALAIILCSVFSGLNLFWAINLKDVPTPWRIIFALVSLDFIILAVGLANCGRHMRNEPIVIEAIEKPQIDTIITTINGVSDTTYVYHIKKNS